VAKAVEDVPPQDRDIDLPFSHAELLRLAANLEDLNEILLAGVSGRVHFRLECVDSSFWTISHEGEDGDTVGSWFSTLQAR
jgi:hypothetical protein